MDSLAHLQQSAIARMKQTLPLASVTLKHPFPMRPRRMLGLIRFDGEVYRCDKISRAVFMQIRLPVFMKVFTTFIFPKIEYDLPVFICETVILGGRRVFIVDAHKAGQGGEKRYDAFFDRLVAVRAGYPDLMAYQKVAAPGLASLNSRAACQVKIPRELDGRAAGLFEEYFAAYLELVSDAAPLAGSDLEKARASFDAYLETVVDHDPGVKGNIIFFGRQQGIERALDIFYGV